MLKFNSFCKKEFSNINNEINFESKDNINNDSINSDIFNFFHGDKERPNIAIQTKNIFDINEHNNSIKLNEVNNLVINEEKKNYDEDKNAKIDYTKDKNYNDALKLRQILETKKDSTEEETNEQNKLNLHIKKLKEVREKEKEKARRKYGKVKYDDKKLIGCPNFTKNTFSSVTKNIS